MPIDEPQGLEFEGELPDGLDELRRLWGVYAGVEAVAKAIDQVVVRWEWFTSGIQWSLEPFAAERLRVPRGRKLSAPPEPPAGVDHCGSDRSGRVVIVQSYNGAGDGLESQTVNLFDRDSAIQLRYDGRGRLHVIARYEWRDGRLVHSLSVQEGGVDWNEAIYEHDDVARLVRSRGRCFRQWARDDNVPRFAAGAEETFTYDERGRLAEFRVRSLFDGQERLVYKRSQKGTSRGALKDRVVQRLVDSVTDAVAEVQISEPMWCLALHYDPGDPLPPVPVLGAERELREWGPEVDLLNPAEWDAPGPPRRLELDDPELQDDCAMLWSQIADHTNAERQAGDLLTAVARLLNEVDWSQRLPVTGDFFVYAVDLEGEHLERNLRKAVSRERLRELRRAGLTE